MNGQTGEQTIYAEISEYYLIWGDDTALDTKNRILYAYMEKGQDGPFYLLGIDADTGSIISSSVACSADSSGCPASLLYYNGGSS